MRSSLQAGGVPQLWDCELTPSPPWKGRRHGWDNVNEEVCDVNVNFIQMNSNGETVAKETKINIYEMYERVMKASNCHGFWCASSSGGVFELA